MAEMTMAKEIARRRDEVLLRALSTPPKHHSKMKLGKRKAKASQKESPAPSVKAEPPVEHTERYIVYRLFGAPLIYEIRY